RVRHTTVEYLDLVNHSTQNARPGVLTASAERQIGRVTSRLRAPVFEPGEPSYVPFGRSFWRGVMRLTRPSGTAYGRYSVASATDGRMRAAVRAGKNAIALTHTTATGTVTRIAKGGIAAALVTPRLSATSRHAYEPTSTPKGIPAINPIAANVVACQATVART